MERLPDSNRTTKKALGISAGLHAAFFLTVLCTSLFSPPPPPLPKTLLVRTVMLRQGPAMKTVAVPASPRQEQASQGASEGGSSKEEPSEVAEEPVKEEAPTPAPQKAPAPSKAAKASAAAKPATPSSKKGSPSAKTTTQGKAKPSASTKGTASKYDQKLLGEALRRLDRSKSAAARTEGSGSGSGKGSGSGSGGVARVGTVGALNVESGVAIAGAGTDADDSCEGYETASPEACYIADMIRRLQLNIRLPEPGEVRVKLTLKRNGAIMSVEVLSGSKASIKQVIEKKLKAVHFSPFGMGFSTESEHTFNLRLSNDLIWSCGR